MIEITNEEALVRKENESDNSYLVRICGMKDHGELVGTWTDVCNLLNEVLRNGMSGYDESTWRKRYRRLKNAYCVAPKRDIYIEDYINTEEKNAFIELEEQRARLSRERCAFKKIIRDNSKITDTLELIAETIKTIDVPDFKETEEQNKEKAIYVMLSDIHYGIEFNNAIGKYNKDIAYDRLQKYANRIIKEAKTQGNIETCYLSLMGDLISGNNHASIKFENKEDTISQVIGVSSLIEKFIYRLLDQFKYVYVNYTSGNHSRIESSLEESLKDEKLDRLIPWHLGTAFKTDRVIIQENEYDPTFATFEIFDNLYISVHGDLDNNFNTASQRIFNVTKRMPAAFLLGHMHVSEIRLENIAMIRNGSVCGSGDEYTIKKRLFGPPAQTFMIVDKNGIDGVFPVNLLN